MHGKEVIPGGEQYSVQVYARVSAEQASDTLQVNWSIGLESIELSACSRVREENILLLILVHSSTRPIVTIDCARGRSIVTIGCVRR